MNEPADARRFPRYACHGPVRFRIHNGEIKGKITNLCLEGCLVRPTEQLAITIGDRIDLRFKVNGLVFFARCVVRRIGQDQMFGVEIERISERGRRQLIELLEELEKAQPQFLKQR